MSKVLVSYFSASGVTKGVAQRFASAINGDLFEIEPVERYTGEDLDWTNKQSRSSIEMNENIKPEILSRVSNLGEYDTICLAFPIWWYKEPTIIDKFLEENDLLGKAVYVFVTSGSSTVNESFQDLKETYPQINFVSGRRFTESETSLDIEEWINNN